LVERRIQSVDRQRLVGARAAAIARLAATTAVEPALHAGYLFPGLHELVSSTARREPPWRQERRSGRINPAPRAMSPYVTFLLYLVAILGFIGLALSLNAVLGPKPALSRVKQEPFECGATPVEFINTKAVPVKYYGVAIIFILFDLETMFLFIWTLGARPLTGFKVFTLFIFIFLLVISLLYVYRARVLEAVTE
jgi:NADH-quinone oxidoreductase subunit A